VVGGVILRMGQFWGCVIVGGRGAGVFNNGNKVQFVKLFGQVLCGGGGVGGVVVWGV